MLNVTLATEDFIVTMKYEVFTKHSFKVTLKNTITL